MNTTQMLLTGTTALAEGISKLKGHSREWHKLTQQVAASAVVHAHTTGDIRPLDACLRAMPAGSKTNNMRQYFLNFAPVKWSDTTKKFKFVDTRKVVGIVEGADNDLLTAVLNKHWSSCGPVEKADNFKPYDLKAKLLRLVLDANKALEGENKDKQTVKGVEVNAVAELIRQLYPDAA